MVLEKKECTKHGRYNAAACNEAELDKLREGTLCSRERP
jgi:hypothetical protein